MSNTNKLGSYIQTLMGTIVAKDEEDFVKQLALDELKRLGQDVNDFIEKHKSSEIEDIKKTEKILLQEDKKDAK